MQVGVKHRQKYKILQLSLLLLGTVFKIDIIIFYISSAVNFAKINS